MNERDMRREVKFEPNDCELMSRSKVEKERNILKAEIVGLKEQVHYWINAYEEEVQKKGRNNE